MTQIATRAALGMCLAGCLACAGCRGEPDRFHWKSPLAWRPFRAHSAEVAATLSPDPGTSAEVNESLGEPYLAGQAEDSWVDERQSPLASPAAVPLAPLAPPADYEPAQLPEFPYAPESTRSTSQPQPPETPSLRRRPKLSEFIDGIREGRPSEPRPKSIPWDEPVADAGAQEVLTLAPIVVAFEQSQPVTLGAPEFDAVAPKPAQAPVVEVSIPAPRVDGLTVFEREFKAIR